METPFLTPETLKDSSILSSCLLYPGKLIKAADIWNIILAWTTTHCNIWSSQQMIPKPADSWYGNQRGKKNPKGDQGKK